MRHVTLTLYIVLIAAIPASNAVPLAPRSNYCSNAPTTVAGTTLVGITSNPRSIIPLTLLARATLNNIKWCVPNSQTFITLRLTANLSPLVLEPLFATIRQSVDTHLLDSGDGFLPGGGYAMQRNNLVFELTNANNHQCTWGVLYGTVWALTDFMRVKDMWGEVEFDVFDGGNQVASGTIGI